jgi:CHAT domain-containing protein/tetratricopeptide (TPR) repeat protein
MTAAVLLLTLLAGSSAPEALAPGTARQRRMAPSAASHAFTVSLPAGAYAGITVAPRGMDVEVLLSGPSGERPLLRVDDAWTNGGEALEWVGEDGAPASYRIEVRNKRPAVAGSYEIRVSPARPATPADHDRVQAARALGQGRQLVAERKPEQLRQALAVLEKALALSRGAADQRGQGLALIGLGDAYAQLNEFPVAIDRYEAALGLWQALGDAPRQAAALARAANSFQRLGRLEEDQECAEQALGTAREAGDREGELKALLALAVPQNLLGQPDLAVASGRRALDLARALGDRDSEGEALSNLSGVHVGLNDWQRALDVVEQTLVLNREVGNRRLEALNLNSLGLIYTNLGDTRRALQSHERSLALCRELGDRVGESIVLHNIGLAHRLDGDHERAIESFDAALVLKRALGDRRSEVRTLVSLSSVHLARGDHARARDVIQQTLSIREGSHPAVEATARINLAVVSAASGDLERARELCLQALDLSLRPEDPGVWVAVYRLAEIEKARGALAEAEDLAELALEMLDSMRAEMRSVDFRASMLASQRDVYDLHVDVLMARHAADPAAGFDARAWQSVERARARSLLDLLAEARAEVREGVEPGLRERERKLLDRLSAASARSLRASGPAAEVSAQREVEVLSGELERVSAEIRARSPRYAALTRPEPLGMAGLQALLDDDTLLLEYALGKGGSYAWLVGPRSLTTVVLPTKTAIEAAARRLLSALESRQADAEAAAAELSGLVLAPLGDRLSSRRLVVVADGALQYVPFAALPHPRSGLALVVRQEVVSLPSASTLALLRQEHRRRDARRGTVAVLADPVFDRSDARLGGRRSARVVDTAPGGSLTRAVEAAGIIGPIPRLAFMCREARSILAAAPARSSLGALDFEASRATLMGPKVGQYRVLHLATHGFLNAARPELSGLVLSLFDRAGRPQPGFLTAADAFNLQLSADLVVLSGCRTALGKEVKGEGLVGLTRGFMYAGADRVLASLWRVDDAATAALMSRLYARMLGPAALSPPAALRAAQLDLMKQRRFRHPFFWAAFQLQGEWR